MNRFSNILFVADSAVDNSAAFNQAVTLAKNNQAKITVVGFVDALNTWKAKALKANEFLDVMVEQRLKQLQTLVQSTSISDSKIEVKILVGQEFIEVIREVLKYQRDLVVKSVEQKNITRQQLFGSIDMKLLRKCPCPVWLIKSTQQQGYRQILIGLDYDPGNDQNDELNRQILEIGASQALADFSELHIVHAWDFEYESFLRSPRVSNSDADVDAMVQEESNMHRRWLEELVNKYCATLGEEVADYLKPQLHLVRGSARNVVPKCARELGVELIVMGTVSRTGIPGFIIGNTAEAILNRIDCSVLAVKPAGFISPVTLEV